MLILLWLVSIVAFVIIQLPPGDHVDSMIDELEHFNAITFTLEERQAIRDAYAADEPMYVQYWNWFTRLIRGDLGVSVRYGQPVAKMLAERVPLTILVSLATMIFTYLVAVPIAIHSATHQYSVGDYLATGFGFFGLATPNFLLALILIYFFFTTFGFAPVGLFSPKFMDSSWSLAKLWDAIKHLPIPIVVIGTAGTAGLIRQLRALMLDELNKQYVDTAWAKGVPARKLLFKYPVRVAIIPIVSTIGWSLAGIFSGATITSIVLNLPTVGPLLYEGLLKQDMILAGSIIMIISALTVLGTFISDILLVVVDPRIRYE
jgi:peptide/nickel transport system permease protein